MISIAYLRVSTLEQSDSGHGLDAQEDACRRGRDISATYMDRGVSGASPLSERPGLVLALDHLGRGDELVVAKRDRLGRDPIVVAMIEAAAKRKGARVVSAAGEGTDGDGPTDVLMRRIVDAFSEYERLVLRARTKAALKAKSDRGERIGRVPFGYRLDADGRHLVESATEQGMMRSIRSLREIGTPWRDIAISLGMHPRTGKRWSHSQVMRLTRLSSLDVGIGDPTLAEETRRQAAAKGEADGEV